MESRATNESSDPCKCTPTNPASRAADQVVPEKGFPSIRSSPKRDFLEFLQWIHDKNGWDTAELGLTVEIEGQVGPFGKLVDLRVEAAWHPRDVPRPPDGPLCEFRLADTASSGETFVVEPKTRPDAGPVPVSACTRWGVRRPISLVSSRITKLVTSGLESSDAWISSLREVAM